MAKKILLTLLVLGLFSCDQPVDQVEDSPISQAAPADQHIIPPNQPLEIGLYLLKSYFDSLKASQSLVKLGYLPIFTSLEVTAEGAVITTSQRSYSGLFTANEAGFWQFNGLTGTFQLVDSRTIVYISEDQQRFQYEKMPFRSFEEALNATLLGATYIDINNNDQQVRFARDGTIVGPLDDYTHFRLSYQLDELRHNQTGGYDLIYLYNAEAVANGAYFVLITEHNVVSFHKVRIDSNGNYRTGKSKYLLVTVEK